MTEANTFYWLKYLQNDNGDGLGSLIRAVNDTDVWQNEHLPSIDDDKPCPRVLICSPYSGRDECNSCHYNSIVLIQTWAKELRDLLYLLVIHS